MDNEEPQVAFEPQIKPQSRIEWVKSNPRVGIIGIFIALFILFAVGTALTLRNEDNKAGDNNNDSQKVAPLANNTIIYGYWSENSSVIRASDLSAHTDNIIAVLPYDVKHVRILSSNTLSYINGTDEYDHGKEIVIRNITDNTERTVLTSSEGGFGIDDYVVSPNGQYIATWELTIPDSGSVSGGKSRVYSSDINGNKNLLYDESSSPGNAVHYPIAITNNGDVFTDKFLPNSGNGYGYGMDFSNFTGSAKEPIEGMINGTYSTQPLLSPKGDTLVFAGYDGGEGDGKEIINDVRRAILLPNTVDILDLSTRKRSTVVPSQPNIVFPVTFWDYTSNAILYAQISKDENQTGSFRVDLTSKTPQSVIGSNKKLINANPNILTSLRGGKLLEIETVTVDSALGNLGSKYAPSVSVMYVLDPSTGEKTKIDIAGGYAQFIDLKGANFFATNDKDSDKTGKGNTTSENQLQLQTFSLKPTLAEKREEQQSNPPNPENPRIPNPIPPVKCDETAAKICNELLGTDFDPKIYDSTPNTAYNKCFREQGKRIMGGAVTTCGDSPLYLYGTEGMRTKVTIGTHIYSTNVPYNPEDGFDITLGKNGNFIANKKSVESLSFDYLQAIKRLDDPTNGYIVTHDKVQSTLLRISQDFGFNEKETHDLFEYANKNITKDYVLVSFYDDLTSKKILPIYISPTPDNFRNIVFYFKQFASNPNISIDKPLIDPIKRFGFTAIEISYIVH